MTIASESLESPQRKEHSPALAIGAVVLVVLALIAGGWYGWRAWFSTPTESAEFDAGVFPNMRFRGFAPAQPPPGTNTDGIHALGGNMYRVQSGEYFMTVPLKETSYAPIRLIVNRRDFVTPEQRALIQLCNQYQNPAIAGGLSLTPDQTKQMASYRAQINGFGMTISDEDHKKLSSLWSAWNAAKDNGAKAQSEKDLLAAEKEIGASSLPASQKHFADLAAMIKKVLTDQQYQSYKRLRGF